MGILLKSLLPFLRFIIKSQLLKQFIIYLFENYLKKKLQTNKIVKIDNIQIDKNNKNLVNLSMDFSQVDYDKIEEHVTKVFKKKRTNIYKK